MSALELYAMMSGDELWSSARTKCYLAGGVKPQGFNLLDEGTPGLVDIVAASDEPYILPHVDPAPWYEAAIPESADFAGLLVESVEVSAAPSASMSQRIGHGAVIGRRRLQGRTVTVTGWLMGRTCAAVNYGLNWLTSALIPPCVGETDCGGADLCFLDAMPSMATVDCLTECIDGDEVPNTDRDGEPPEWIRGSEWFRTFKGVSLLDGPHVLEKHGDTCGGCTCGEMTRVEFTLGVAQPWKFSEPVPVIVGARADSGVGQLLPELECTDWPDCSLDPQCPPPPPPPRIPVPMSDCVEVPRWVRRVSAEITSDMLSDWFDATTIVEIKAGPRRPTRNFVLRMAWNPAGFECGDPNMLRDCDACSSLFVTYIPPGGILRVDGTTRRITMTCGNTTRDAASSVFTVEGQPFSWLDLTCSPACITGDFPIDQSGIASTLSVWLVGRTLGS